MKLVPVSLALFHRMPSSGFLEVWTQRREDDGIYHGLLEFPGGGIEKNETPLEAVVREVQEEVGISIDPGDGKLMGIYTNEFPGRVILLNVILFPDLPGLEGKGRWLRVGQERLSADYEGQIPSPNHRIIDDLYRSLYSSDHE